MRRFGFLFADICSFENLYAAFKRAFKGSGRTREACKFHFNLERELLKVKEELETESYRPSKYRYFKTFDPKERTISVAPFRDRVVHHALVRVLEPIFDPKFIYDSYATRKGKGTHKALRRAQESLRKKCFYFKTDVLKYFDSVEHEILLDLIKRRVKDKRTLEVIERIIKNSDVSRGLAQGKGLPIGNLTSQFFANVYLDPLDHFVKDELGVKHYIRYMDDIVLFGSSRKRLKGLRDCIKWYLDERLRLRLKCDATMLNSRLHGLPFLGFRVFPNLLRVKKENLKRLKRRLERRRIEFQSDVISEDRFVMSVRSIFEHMSFADSFKLRNLMLHQ